MSPNSTSTNVLRFPARPRLPSAIRSGGAEVIALRPAARGIVHCPAVSYHEAAIAAEAPARKA